MKKSFSRNSKGVGLQGKFLALMLAVSLIPVIGVALLSVNQTQNALTDAAQSSLTTGASQIAAALDATIKSNLDSIRVEAQQNVFVSYLNLSAAARGNSSLKNSVRSELITLSLKEPTYILSYALVDLKGKIIADTLNKNIGKSEKLEDYFVNVLKNEVPYATPVSYNENGDLIIHFAAPVRDQTGEIIGVLRSEYTATVLQEIIGKSIQGSAQNITVSLFDEYNIRIADSSEPEIIQKSLIPLDANSFESAVAEGRLLPGTSQEQSIDNMDYYQALIASGTSPFFIVDATLSTEGADAVAVASLKTKPWKLAYSQPQALFLEDVQRQTTTNILIVFGIAVLVAVIAFFTSRQVTTPIKKLSEVAVSVANGNLDVRTDIQSGDEIGALASSLNLMTSRLQEILSGLEQRVADRTKALATSTEVSRRLSTILNQNELVSEVVNQVNKAFGYYHTQIYFFDESNQNLVMAGGTGEAGEMMLAQFHKVAKGRGLVGRAAENNEPILVSDTANNPDWLPNVLLPETKSEAAIPISLGDTVLGVLDVQHNIVDGLKREDIDALQSIANQVAVAIQNARSYSKTWEAQQLTRNVIDSTDDWIFIKDQDHRYQLVNQGYAKSLHIPIADFIGRNDLELGFPEELVKGNPEKGIRGFWADDRSVMDSGVTRQIPDDLVTIDGNIHVFDTVKVPLRDADNKVWGVLAFARDMTERRSLEEINRKRAFQQEAINMITQKIQGTTSIEMALQITARELGHALGAQTAVHLETKDEQKTTVAIGERKS